MQESNRGGVATEVAVVVGMALIVVVAAVLLVAMGVKWLTEDRQAPKPMVITMDDNSGDSSDVAERETEEEGQRVAERQIKVDSAYFTDSRDGKGYRSVTIGGMVWMAEDLRYAASKGSWCFKDDCDTYGRVYDFRTAKTVCPSGWHLPTILEWDSLGTVVGGGKWRDADSIFYWFDAGTRLKAKRGWNEELKGILLIRKNGSNVSITEDRGQSGNGTDDYGFSALPSNFRFPTAAGDFGNDFAAQWWTATGAGEEYANRMYILHDKGDLFGKKSPKTYGFSVRCVADG